MSCIPLFTVHRKISDRIININKMAEITNGQVSDVLRDSQAARASGLITGRRPRPSCDAHSNYFNLLTSATIFDLDPTPMDSPSAVASSSSASLTLPAQKTAASSLPNLSAMVGPGAMALPYGHHSGHPAAGMTVYHPGGMVHMNGPGFPINHIAPGGPIHQSRQKSPVPHGAHPYRPTSPHGSSNSRGPSPTGGVSPGRRLIDARLSDPAAQFIDYRCHPGPQQQGPHLGVPSPDFASRRSHSDPAIPQNLTPNFPGSHTVHHVAGCSPPQHVSPQRASPAGSDANIHSPVHSLDSGGHNGGPDFTPMNHFPPELHRQPPIFGLGGGSGSHGGGISQHALPLNMTVSSGGCSVPRGSLPDLPQQHAMPPLHHAPLSQQASLNETQMIYQLQQNMGSANFQYPVQVPLGQRHSVQLPVGQFQFQAPRYSNHSPQEQGGSDGVAFNGPIAAFRGNEVRSAPNSPSGATNTENSSPASPAMSTSTVGSTTHFQQANSPESPNFQTPNRELQNLNIHADSFSAASNATYASGQSFSGQQQFYASPSSNASGNGFQGNAGNGSGNPMSPSGQIPEIRINDRDSDPCSQFVVADEDDLCGVTPFQTSFSPDINIDPEDLVNLERDIDPNIEQGLLE